MIKKIREIIFPKKTPALGIHIPYDLNREKLKELHALTLYPEWSKYQSLLDSIATLSAEDLLQTRSTEDIHSLRGYILGLRKAGIVINELVKDLEKEDARSTERAARDDERNTIRAQLATFGSRIYKPSKPGADGVQVG